MDLNQLPSALQLFAILMGTVVVPLIIYLFSRRAQLRQLNTTSDASLVTSAAALVTSLQDQIKILDDKLVTCDKSFQSHQRDFVSQLSRAHDENTRIAIVVAQLQTEIDIYRRQLADLRATL